MIVTEAEALKRWCPFSRPEYPRSDDCGYQAGNRRQVGDDEPIAAQIGNSARCIGTACMAWRWEKSVTANRIQAIKDRRNETGCTLKEGMNWYEAQNHDERVGSCGLCLRDAA